MVQKFDDYTMVGPAVNFSKSGNYIRSPPPTLGEHTREILKNVINLSDAEIDTLYSSQIVQ